MEEYDLEIYRLKSEICKTFSDPRRLIIIEALRHGERSVGELVQVLGIPQAGASRHLAILRDRGVVRTRREGTTVYYSLTDPKILEACDIVHRVLLNQLGKGKELAEKLES